MKERLLLPPNYHLIEEDTPVIFLAGPIQGSPDWQNPTAERLLTAHNHILVASPRLKRKSKNFDKREQVTWELDHIDRAMSLGGVAFWFAAQDHSLPYETGRSYAQTSRVELGAVMMAQRVDPSIPVWVGFDPAYTENGGGSQEYIEIAHEWFTDNEEIFYSLDEMVEAMTEDIKSIN